MSPRFARPRLAVVKIGSSSLRGPDGRLDPPQVEALAQEVVAAREAGTPIVLVSSGAVAAGMGLLGLTRRPPDLPTLQAAAAVGQSELIQAYQRVFTTNGLTGAQILLSQDDFVRRTRYLNARTTLQRLLELGAVPIINENDAITTDELAYGDNDHLAALVTSMLDAALLVLLSDVDGLYDRDPRTDGARLVDRIEHPDELAGLDTAGFVSGYRGSPLGGLDQALWRAQKHLERSHIRFQPGLNEDLNLPKYHPSVCPDGTEPERARRSALVVTPHRGGEIMVG
jgi:glutamate 5-kinase